MRDFFGSDFNCTIQELKLDSTRAQQEVHKHFNCTIQELKLIRLLDAAQLSGQFQLHHTGIKTRTHGQAAELRPNFNCTIQELKHPNAIEPTSCELYFNCTIQELKRNQILCLSIRSFISIAPYRN